jgi:hypothetical protein
VERSGTTDEIVRASEIGEYVHCHRAWWLGRVQGVENRNRRWMDAGTVEHRAHGQRVLLALALRYAAIVCVIIALGAGVLLVLSLLDLL